MVKSQNASTSRDRLLDAAGELLQQHGVAGFNTNDLATTAGVTAPTVYRNFTNKQDVLLALAERFIENEKAWLAGAEPEFLAAPTPFAALHSVVSCYFTLAKQTPGLVPLRQTMRIWPELNAIERESIRASAQWLSRMLQMKYPSKAKHYSRLAISMVETVCSTVDRCYVLPTKEANWRLEMLSSMLASYLAEELMLRQ
ncbi:MAG: TetR/AcrR family transcriptional regulator [Pseudomonadota bacterium]